MRVQNYSLRKSGISYSTYFEWRLASRWAGYRYEDFILLDGDLQSAHIAAYRDSLRLEAVLADAGNRAAAKAARRRR